MFQSHNKTVKLVSLPRASSIHSQHTSTCTISAAPVRVGERPVKGLAWHDEYRLRRKHHHCSNEHEENVHQNRSFASSAALLWLGALRRSSSSEDPRRR